MGGNRPKPMDRTVLVALDMTAAFDTVVHTVVLENLISTEVQPTIKRLVAAYLSGHSTMGEYGGCTSTKRKLRQGVP